MMIDETEIARSSHKRYDELTDHANEAAVKSGESALRLIFLLNGTSAVSLLTFIGSTSKDKLAPAVVNTLPLFAFGALFAALGMSFGFLVNLTRADMFSSVKLDWKHPYVDDGVKTKALRHIAWRYKVLCIGSATVAMLIFVYAIFAVRSALS